MLFPISLYFALSFLLSLLSPSVCVCECVYSFQPFKFYSVLRFNQFKDIFAALEKYSCWMSCIRPFIFSRFFCSALKTYTVFPFHIASRSGIYIESSVLFHTHLISQQKHSALFFLFLVIVCFYVCFLL